MVSLSTTVVMANYFRVNKNRNFRQDYLPGIGTREYVKVTNNNNSVDYFVPWKTASEWQKFVTHRPSGIVICAPKVYHSHTINAGGIHVTGCDNCNNRGSKGFPYCLSNNTSRTPTVHTLNLGK